MFLLALIVSDCRLKRSLPLGVDVQYIFHQFRFVHLTVCISDAILHRFVSFIEETTYDVAMAVCGTCHESENIQDVFVKKHVKT